MLAHGTESRTNGSTATPSLEGLAPELLSLIGNDVLGLATVSVNCSIERSLHLAGGRWAEEHCEADHGTRIDIDIFDRRCQLLIAERLFDDSMCSQLLCLFQQIQ